jgi:hypothetical protein
MVLAKIWALYIPMVAMGHKVKSNYVRNEHFKGFDK